MRLCNHLRWKAFYGADWPDHQAMELAMKLSDSPFSCLRTCQPWGPDGHQCAPEGCQPERSCFEPSPREPREPRLS